MSRLLTSTPSLDAAEEAWWREYGDLEERFCWVQPAPVRRQLRMPYVREIAALAQPGDRVLELGCGTGWLSLLLAEEGVRLTATDFSPEQIQRARASAEGREDLEVDFRVAGIDELALEGERYDLVITHAFLHHLATDEVRTVLRSARSLLAPNGRLVAVEPILYGTGRTERTWAERVLNGLARLPLVLSNHRLRRMGPEELATRLRVQGRGEGVPPLGPSPKESAFVDDELLDLLAEQVPVYRREPVAALVYRVAEELLLAELSQPRTWRAIRGPLLRIAQLLDQRLIRAARPLEDVWIFELYVCEAGE